MPDADSPDYSPLHSYGDDEQALDAVREVTAWYAARIAAERRAPVPDEDRIQELSTARHKAVEDQARAEEAGPEEAARIAADYAARLQALKDQ
ncbi:hypothetical protein AB0M05_41590 [Streptomyces violaceusniger]|uniref:hypothetical protein n=1 Tax=Streptomyces violaceusniger TaxID=68280 RepID=UPI0034320569